MLPKDPVILLSVINTKLRDCYRNLDDLCEDMEADRETILKTLAAINYHYHEQQNQFII